MFKRILLIIAIASMPSFVFAEDAAPVYDVDNMPSQFDGQADNGSSSATPSPAPAPQLQPEIISPQALTMDQRIARLEQQLNNAEHSNSASKAEQLQSEVQVLRGQVEELTHQVQTLQTQQHTVVTDVEKQQTNKQPPHKIEKLASNDPETGQNSDELKSPKVASQEENKTENAPDALKKNENPQPNLAEQQQAFQSAYDLVKVNKNVEAISVLQKMLQKYPSGQFAANAHFSLGQLYGLTGKNDKSAEEYSTVITDFPESPKIADAHYRLGLIYVSEEKWSEAKSALKRVIRKYPGTSPAHLAAEQLKQIKKAGH